VDESTPRDTRSERGWQPNTLLTKAEFCQWAGVSERTLGQWITDGTAPPRVLLGRHVRFRFSDCLEWLASRYVT
jgi:excisionase family DNA binding protein